MLDNDGFAHIDNVAAGTATIEFVPDYDEKVKLALEQLNQMLKAALQHAYQETKMLDKEWDKTHWMDKPVILAGSLAVGIGDAVHDFALSIVHLLQGVQKTLTSTGNWLGRYTSYHEQRNQGVSQLDFKDWKPRGQPT